MKKILSIILVLCMAVLVVPFSAFAADGLTADANGVYHIKEYADFAKITDKTATYVLDNDITIDTITITSSGGRLLPDSFSGVLDGQNNKITVTNTVSIPTNVSSGIVGNDFKGTLKNITLGTSTAPIVIEAEHANIGVISNQTNGKTVLENVTVYANMTLKRAGAVNGGILFGKDNSTSKDVFVNCNVYGSITSTNTGTPKHAGAFMGQVSQDGSVYMVNCTANVAFNVTNATVCNVGGFIGGTAKTVKLYAINSTSSDSIIINNGGSNTTVKTATVSVETLDGAYIKYAKPQTAMRFEGQIKTADITALTEIFGADTVKYGISIDGTAIDYTDSTYFSTDETNGTANIVAVIDGITSDKYTETHTAVAYMAVNIGGETAEWLYIYDDATTTRSVAQVAQKVLDDELTSTDEKYTEKLGILVDFGAQKGE